jgi:uncharacterized repeat protein (TIGR03803 family)
MQCTPALVLASIVLCLFHSAPGVANGDFTYTTIASFSPPSGINPNGTPIVDAAGNIYGTTASGGTHQVGTVYEIAKGSNTATTLASFNGTTNGATPTSLTLDANGNLYGTTTGGGVNNQGTVFEIAKGSNTITTLASFGAFAISVGGLTLDANGNLYGTSSGGGAIGEGSVYEIVKGSNTITTLASFNGTNGISPQAGVTLDAYGNLYGTTSESLNSQGTVFEIAKGSNIITTLASFNGTNGATPSGVTLDANGNLYGTTLYGGANNVGTVFEIANGSDSVTTLVSFNGIRGSGPANGVTLDASGNLFGTTEYGGNAYPSTVFEIANGSNTITTLASLNGSNGNVTDGGVTLDADGNLYGTTYYGGANGSGSVFELSPSVVPEPASLAMLAMGTLMAAGYAAFRSVRSPRRCVGSGLR